MPAKRGRPLGSTKPVRDFRGEHISFAEAVTLLGMPERSFTAMVEQGSIPQAPGGGYFIGEVIDGYFRYLTSKEGLNNARTRLTLAKAEITEAELAEKKGELHRSSVVMHVWNDYVANAKARLLAVPTKIATACAGLSKEQMIEVQDRAKVEIYDALHELAGYNAKVIQDAGEALL